jgi:hypothetical protein
MEECLQKRGKKIYRKLRNELKNAVEKAKNYCLESICDEIVEFKRRGFVV